MTKGLKLSCFTNIRQVCMLLSLVVEGGNDEYMVPEGYAYRIKPGELDTFARRTATLLYLYVSNHVRTCEYITS